MKHCCDATVHDCQGFKEFSMMDVFEEKPVRPFMHGGRKLWDRLFNLTARFCDHFPYKILLRS